MIDRTEELRERLRPHYPVAFELFYAVVEGTVADVQRRLDAGDDPNARSVDGRTPLAFASSRVRHLPKADLLFAAGAKVESCDDLGMQPIHWTTECIFADDLSGLTWLLDRGADPSVAVGVSEQLQFHPVGWTPLHIAAHSASVPATQLLVDRHANVDARAADGSTALHVAAKQFLAYKRLIRILLDGGADVDAADARGRTPLHVLAAEGGRYRKAAISLLRSRNARLDLRDADGLRPVELLSDGISDTPDIRRILGEAS